MKNTYLEFELFTLACSLLNLTVEGASEAGVQIGRKLEYVFGKATGNPHGEWKVQSFWENNRLITIELFGGK